ncbi:MAG: glutamine synthetase [Bacteroidia bacterium]|nr:glutamine synthetase [Bacteroidia bacterium]
MKESEILLNPNKLVKYLKKPASEFTKQDIIKYVIENGIEMINFRYVPEDGKLKTLNFIISSYEHLENVLSSGERVDGSSLFSYIDSGSSDLYVIPRFKTAFVDPFAEIPTISFLCSFYNNEGKPLESAPEYILKKAHLHFKKSTGCTFKAMGELEYYAVSNQQKIYPAVDQKGYHSSEPFAKYAQLRREAMALIAEAGGLIKYGHAEVGSFTKEGILYEQHEIEFMPTDVEDAMDQLVLAKWILRMLGNKYGIVVSFAPKISVGKAGSGLHIHMMVEKDGKNILVENNMLSESAKKMIAGILEMSTSLTAFGNTIPTSYLRLVPHQEAPTYICWGNRNRSALVRVPLGWMGVDNMIKDANPNEPGEIKDYSNKQTYEFRVPDGSADIYLLAAGLIVSSLYGLEMPDALKKADEFYVSVNIFKAEFKDKLKHLKQLPVSCWHSAECLEKNRYIYEKNGIFPKGTIDSIIKILQSYNDRNLSEELYGMHEEIKKLVEKYLHYK